MKLCFFCINCYTTELFSEQISVAAPAFTFACNSLRATPNPFELGTMERICLKVEIHGASDLLAGEGNGPFLRIVRFYYLA